jgi:uncharacterized membrane-anchored protein
MKIDFNARKTEVGWQQTVDDFWKEATPTWFEWLEWILVLGAITFLAKETQGTILEIISAVSYIALFFYLQSFFFSFEFHGFPLIRSERVRRFVSLTASAILSIALWLLLTSMVSDIQGKV